MKRLFFKVKNERDLSTFGMFTRFLFKIVLIFNLLVFVILFYLKINTSKKSIKNEVVKEDVQRLSTLDNESKFKSINHNLDSDIFLAKNSEVESIDKNEQKGESVSLSQEIINIVNNKNNKSYINFREIVKDVTGNNILKVDLEDDVAKAFIDIISMAINECLKKMNVEDAPLTKLPRINEASKFFEDFIHKYIDDSEDFSCKVPSNKKGAKLRSGYPDLIIEHLNSKKKCYLDPKLYERGSERSSQRTFYYTPRIETSKILHDAYHLILGIQHDGKKTNKKYWLFTSWSLSDLYYLKVRLKPELQASNREMYGDELIVKSSKINK